MIRGLLRRKASASPKYRANSAKLSRVAEEMLQRQEAGRDEPLREADPLGIGMDGACDDQADVQAVVNGFEPLVHEQGADL